MRWIYFVLKVFSHCCDLAWESPICTENLGLVGLSWRPTTVKWCQFSQSNTVHRHSTTEYHEALPSSANDEVRCDCTFADDGNASWYSVCRVPVVVWRLDCENCRHLTVVCLYDTGPWARCSISNVFRLNCFKVYKMRYIQTRKIISGLSVYLELWCRATEQHGTPLIK